MKLLELRKGLLNMVLEFVPVRYAYNFYNKRIHGCSMIFALAGHINEAFSTKMKRVEVKIGHDVEVLYKISFDSPLFYYMNYERAPVLAIPYNRLKWYRTKVRDYITGGTVRVNMMLKKVEYVEFNEFI